MTSAVTNVAMPTTPAFNCHTEPPIAADGIAAPAADASPAGTISVGDPRQSEESKSAQIGVQVPNALLAIFIANTSTVATAPHVDHAAAFADFAMNAAASGQSANNESAGSSWDSSGDSGASDSGSSARAAGVDIQGTGTTPNSKGSSPPVHIIPSWHVIPRMRIV
jgi:hypothetical protein